MALLAVGGIRALFSDGLTFGLRILLLVLVAAVLLPLILANPRGHVRVTRPRPSGSWSSHHPSDRFASVALLASTLQRDGGRRPLSFCATRGSRMI